VTSRLSVPPDGIFGGEAGAAGRFVVNGAPITTQARVTLRPGDVVRLDLPGGGGYGKGPSGLSRSGDTAAHEEAEVASR
jgi:N-methylhydantoinase B